MSSITFFYGAADAAFSFTLRDWVNDDRQTVVDHAEEQIEKCNLLQTKISHYRNEIIKYLEQEEEEE